MESNPLRRVYIGLLIVCAVGCAPAVVLEKPKDWPQEYAKRQLYNTPNAFVYASSKEAAGEADRLIIAVKRDFEKETGRKAGKGLVFVTDANDGLLVPALQQIIELELKKRSLEAKAKKKAEQAKDEPFDPLVKWNEFKKKLDDLGVTVGDVFKAIPFPLPDKKVCTVLGFPKSRADETEWMMAMPTKAVIRDAVAKMMVASIKKRKVGPVAEAMTHLLLGIVSIERTLTDGLALMRDIGLFSMWVNAQKDWSEGDKKAKIEAYTQRRMEQTLGGFMMAKIREAEAKRKAEKKAKAEREQGQQRPEKGESERKQ
ncbi:MAG: hypothetical protein GXP25_24420 [Planctomycetes bacterium]|nr:hypothetical protein [Planctomycetota bacterium]